MEIMDKSARRLFWALIVISIFFHLFNLAKPISNVGDEGHFATYAANYVQGKPTFDIHPPLGKVIYSLPLFFFGEDSFDNPEMVRYERSKLAAGFIFNAFPGDYRQFPYISLRLVSAFFGIALAVAVYLFIKAVSGSELAALIAMFFIVFENAVLLETRLILLNGMYLTFGFLALFFVFKKKSWPIWGGLLWGLALGVKLVAVVFIAPVIIRAFFKKDSRDLFEFLFSGFFLFAITVFFLNSLFISPAVRLAYYDSLDLPVAGKVISPSFWGQSLQAAVTELNISLSGYTTGTLPGVPFESYWYQWPLMIKSIIYWEGGAKNLVLIGNLAVWAIALLSVFWAIFRFKKEYAVLLGGYIFSLAPFILFVRRAAYLYHYFPALIFGISLAAVLIAEYLEKLPPPEKKKKLAVLVGLVVLFFVIVSPVTFGL